MFSQDLNPLWTARMRHRDKPGYAYGASRPKGAIFSNALFAGLKVSFLLALKFQMIIPDVIKIGIRKALQKEVKYD